MSFEDFIKNLTKEDLDKINKEFATKKEKITSYKYGKIKDIDLENIVEIKRVFDKKIFDNWFNNKDLDSDTIKFLKELLKKEENYIKIYKEEDLKVNFITPILNRVNFKILNKIRAFYEEVLTYEAENFILTGKTDFLISEGYKTPKKPYFFIQEFKKGRDSTDPEPQLLAELIAAVELNNWKSIKGAYIVGSTWNFIILTRQKKHKYEYSVSINFDSSKINELYEIYKVLLAVKREIIDMVKE